MPSITSKNLPRNSTEVYDDGFLRVEHLNYLVLCDRQEIKLQRAEFLILSRLVQTPGAYVTTENLWRHAFDRSKVLNLDSLHVLIYRLRRKLSLCGIKIETLIGVGYRLLPVKVTTTTRANES